MTHSDQLPLLADIAGADTERAAALLLLRLPLAIVARDMAGLGRLCSQRGWAACGDYLDNLGVALALVRNADPRLPGDLGTGRVALALQAAGVTLAAAFPDARAAEEPSSWR